MTALTVDAKAGFRGGSRDSLRRVRAVLDQGLATRTRYALEVGEELFAVANLLDEQPALRRALTDPARDAEERAGLISGLLRDQVQEVTLEVVTEAVRQAWSRIRDLADALEYAGIWAIVLGAEAAGRLEELEDELFRFGRIVAGDARLLRALTDRSAPVEVRVRLATDLLTGKSTDATVRLVTHAVTAPRGRTFDEAMGAFVSVAAERKGQLVAVVQTAVELSAQQKDRLRTLLTRQYGRAVDLQIVVDPDIVGGLRIQIGDELIDGSIAGRLDDARRRLAG